MTKFIYWDNSKTVNEKILFEIEIERNDITKADQSFEKTLGYHPMKKPSVGLEIKFDIS